MIFTMFTLRNVNHSRLLYLNPVLMVAFIICQAKLKNLHSIRIKNIFRKRLYIVTVTIFKEYLIVTVTIAKKYLIVALKKLKF